MDSNEVIEVIINLISVKFHVWFWGNWGNWLFMYEVEPENVKAKIFTLHVKLLGR